MVSTYCCNNNSVVYNGAPAVHSERVLHDLTKRSALWRLYTIRNCHYYPDSGHFSMLDYDRISAIRNFYVLDTLPIKIATTRTPS